MSEPQKRAGKSISQAEFEQFTQLVSSEFKVSASLLDFEVPTYYLKQPQETKQAFLRLLKKLEPTDNVAILRKHERLQDLIVLRILPKPPARQFNVIVNWILFFATIATTFVTGYLISLEIIELAGNKLDPVVGGIAFTVAIMVVLASHEWGHKLFANKRKVDATPPYFIPGLPPLLGIFGLGTYGAVIFQKSTPANRDSLFDISSSGPLAGFIAATIVTAIGLTLSIPIRPPERNVLPPPTPLFILLYGVLNFLRAPQLPSSNILLLHPIALAGWVGLLITMLNLLPVAMLDGGHVVKSLTNENIRGVLTALTLVLLTLKGFWLMIILVLLMSTFELPGPLDDVSSLSKGRKLFTIVLVAIFILSFPL